MNSLTLWAKAVLEFPNLVFCVIDTTSIDHTSDVLRLYTMNKYGRVDASLLIHPGRYPGQLNTEWTGLTVEQMEHAETIEKCWPAIVEAFKGKFVLSYNLSFVQRQLAESAEHYKLEPLYILGTCLQQAAKLYFQRVGFTGIGLSLQEACRRIGYSVPDKPSAEVRAQAQLALLRAMAEGVTSPPVKVQVGVEEGEGLGDLEHPF